MKNSTRILISFLFLITSVYPKVYIVSESGGDFTQIQDAVNVAVAGDTILVKEKSTPYFEAVHFIRSGNETDGYITLKAYPGERPVIDGSNYNFGSDYIAGLIKIINKSYITVEGFEIRNLITSNGNIFPAGIWVRGNSSHIKIINNAIHNIQHNNPDAGAHGLAFYGTSPSQSMNDLLIAGNEIYNCTLAWSESLVLNGNVEYFLVKNNVVHDNDNIAFDFIGFEGTCPDDQFDQARNGTVSGNIAYNIDSRTNPAYGGEGSADGFYVDGGKDIIFDGNLAYNCNIGFEFASEHSGRATSGITARNNFIINNQALGISIGGYDSQRGKTTNCTIVNNTLYHNRISDFDWGAEINIGYYCSGNVFKNNIIYSGDNSSLIEFDNSTGDNFTFEHNLYYSDGSPEWIWHGSYYSNFSDYTSNSGLDANSIYTNPLFDTDAFANYQPKILSGSPAIDAGGNLDSLIVGSHDFMGNDRIYNGVIDIGAYEYSLPNGVGESLDLPSDFKLLPAFPNPFFLNGKHADNKMGTTIKFVGNSEIEGKPMNLKIYTINGKVINNLFSGKVNKRDYSFLWDGRDSNGNYVSNGIYFAVLQLGKNMLTDKIIFIK